MKKNPNCIPFTSVIIVYLHNCSNWFQSCFCIAWFEILWKYENNTIL